jgi:hypothetical protein
MRARVAALKEIVGTILAQTFFLQELASLPRKGG